MSNKPQAYSGFTHDQLVRIASCAPQVSLHYVAKILSTAEAVASQTHIAIDGTTHRGQAHPCALCDAMENHLVPPEELRKPTPNHNPYHNYVTLDGRLTDKAKVTSGGR